MSPRQPHHQPRSPPPPPPPPPHTSTGQRHERETSAEEINDFFGDARKPSSKVLQEEEEEEEGEWTKEQGYDSEELGDFPSSRRGGRGTAWSDDSDWEQQEVGGASSKAAELEFDEVMKQHHRYIMCIMYGRHVILSIVGGVWGAQFDEWARFALQCFSYFYCTYHSAKQGRYDSKRYHSEKLLSLLDDASETTPPSSPSSSGYGEGSEEEEEEGGVVELVEECGLLEDEGVETVSSKYAVRKVGGCMMQEFHSLCSQIESNLSVKLNSILCCSNLEPFCS